MKNKLNALRNCVLEQLQAQDTSQLEKIGSQQCTAILPQLKEELLFKLKALVLSKKDNQLIKRHVWYAQKECISLLDLLPAPEGETALTPLQLLCKDSLEHVLEYLFNTHGYPKEQDVYVPHQHLNHFQINIRDQIPILQSAMKARKVNTELQTLVLAAYTRFTNIKKATYQHLHYMDQLLSTLLKLCK